MMIFVSLIFISLSTLATTTCPSDSFSIPWVLGNSVNCLTINRNSAYFDEAEQKCSNRSGHLLSVSNAYVNTLVAGK